MSKHTPGPWFDKGNRWVRDKRDCAIALVSESKDREANARLIAAAPELLDALDSILFQVIQGKVLERDACITQARAAIAKAKGEA